jgi:hydroxyethylthiazole kinase-like uncharacterized protein yjeF
LSPRSEARGGARLPSLPRRPRDAHKGDFGRLLVVAGSLRMPGAAFLCGEAAMRSGAGLVTIAAPEPAIPVLGAKVVVETLAPLPANDAGTIAGWAAKAALRLASECDAVALGPGLTTDGDTPRFVREFVDALDKPLVLDADGLNAHVGAAERLASRRAPTILTPHPGEAGRLLGRSAAEVQSSRDAAARELARRTGAIVVLKGARTIVTNGRRAIVNRTGNPGMATGGAGDVLTGILGALLARGCDPFEAAVLAAHVHGRAGDLAAEARGEEGLVATDLLAQIPAAIAERVRGRAK